ncbi:WxcM-like domain-containing protein [Candidatus Woesearchaeota archaeon]|nr:WxcM-like domain-containing protein [Candidatus Woesearchaeota archaeon]
MRGIDVKELDKKVDERGWLVEVLRNEWLDKKEMGQFFITTAKQKGVIKGNHYHTFKNEWFCVIKGIGNLVLVDNESGEREEIIMSEEKPLLVKISPGITHAIQNIGEGEMFLLAYTDYVFDKENPDTFRKVVLE